MRHLPMKLGAAVCCQPLCLFQPGRRHAWLSQNDSPNLTEKARHYGHHYDGYYGVRITGIGEAMGTTGRLELPYHRWGYNCATSKRRGHGQDRRTSFRRSRLARGVLAVAFWSTRD